MRHPRHHNRRRTLLTRLMLGLLLVRAYVPVGYMPQAGNPLQLQICSARASTSTPVAPLSRTRTSGNTAHVMDCPFNHSPAAGPIADVALGSLVQAVFSRVLPTFDTQPAGVWELSTHQARAPPTLA
jgi:hypothetical protein